MLSLKNTIIAFVSFIFLIILIIIFSFSDDIKNDLKEVNDNKKSSRKVDDDEKSLPTIKTKLTHSVASLSSTSSTPAVVSSSSSTATKKPLSVASSSSILKKHNSKNNIEPNFFNPIHKKHIGTVIICFFGLVKNVKPNHAQAYLKHLYKQLWANGYSTITLMHTYRIREYSNARSGESNAGGVQLDQNSSLDLLKASFRLRAHDGIEGHKSYAKDFDDSEEGQFKVVFSDPKDADEYFHTFGDFLKHGDPWEGKGNNKETKHQTMKFFLRQQYSLMKLTELLETETKKMKEENKEKKIVGCVYIRPDLLMYDNIDMQLFQFVTEKPKRIALPVWFLYWDTGFVDRFAFGSVDAMIAYGNRGKELREYAKTKQVHAEGYLRHYLCSMVNFEVHLTRTKLARVRTHGVHGPDSPGGLMWLTNSNENRWKSRKKMVTCPFRVWNVFGREV